MLLNSFYRIGLLPDGGIGGMDCRERDGAGGLLPSGRQQIAQASGPSTGEFEIAN
jgi:hypothetical protein